jgi:leucyl aminopeptidase (aminopeptidase T)
VRSVHFHWLLPFPGTRTQTEIVEASRLTEARALKVDLVEHARNQRRLAAALRGRTLRITTPSGTDLSVTARRDEWFHFGDGDASRAAFAAARWLRDRQIELPVGMFQFAPDPLTVTGTVAPSAIFQAGTAVRDARLRLAEGRIAEVTAAAGADWIRRQARENGPDGDRIALISLNTNPLAEPFDIGIDIGSNWENGATNRATRMWRMSLRLNQATVTADGRTLVRDGRIQWAAIAQ